MASAVITWSGIGQASAYDWRNTPSELCDFHSQSQGRCWYVRTALETLCTQIGGEWSASRAKENYWTLLESEFDSGSTSHLSVNWHPGIWQHDRNNYIVTTNAQNNYILFEFCPSITNESWTDMHAESTQAPTCWHWANQLTGETLLAA